MAESLPDKSCTCSIAGPHRPTNPLCPRNKDAALASSHITQRPANLEVMRQAKEALIDAQRYGAGNWERLIANLEAAMKGE